MISASLSFFDRSALVGAFPFVNIEILFVSLSFFDRSALVKATDLPKTERAPSGSKSTAKVFCYGEMCWLAGWTMLE
jgi:hypothetical protein